MHFSRVAIVLWLAVCCRGGFAQEIPSPGYPMSVPQDYRQGVNPAEMHAPNAYDYPPGGPGQPLPQYPGPGGTGPDFASPGPAGPAPLGPGMGPYMQVASPPGGVSPGSLPPNGLPPSGWNANVPQPTSNTLVLPKIVDPKPPAPPPKIWEGNFELGLDGTGGNSETFNFHLGSKIKYKTKEDTLTSEIDYHRNSSSSVTTADNGLQEARAEHSFLDTPWTCYLHDAVNFNEFNNYHLKASADAGIGYQLIKNDVASLIGRFGGGETWEFAGPNKSTDSIPEVVFGLEGECKLSKQQKLTGSVEYRPDATDFTNFRTTAKAGWEVLLDEENHLSLKLGLRDLYDSNSGTKKPNDVDYSATLLWSF